MKEYIYRLRDPRDNQVRYVGRTKNIKQRLQSHISFVSGNKAKAAWIDEIRAANLSPILEVIEEVEDVQVKRRESYWIYTYLEQGIPLLNCMRAIERLHRRGEN